MEENKESETLYGQLNNYITTDYYPFHMPGHKRNAVYNGMPSPYMYDITEIDGFDNLHAPKGILKERMEKVSEFYESKRSYYLVNGSTCGILASIAAALHRLSNGYSADNYSGKTKKGFDTLIMARNSHKAAYNAVLLNGLKTIYLYPDTVEEYGINGGINPKALETLLAANAGGAKTGNADNSDTNISSVYITSPTYEGVVSDIAAISAVCHSYGIPLIVDEAHGAHFSMHDGFPVSALELGADIVVQSLHKTLPSLTQTAILHIGRNSLIEESLIERYLAVYQTSSPSYVLMSSIDRCLDELMKDTFWCFEVLKKRLDEFRSRAADFTNITLAGADMKGRNSVFDFDSSKLIIFPRSNLYTGQTLYQKLLDKYHLQTEMASLRYIIAMTSIMDTQEGFDRLYAALDEIDRDIRIYERPLFKSRPEGIGSVRPPVCKSISEAVFCEQENIAVDRLEGRISGEFIYIYPPGMPIIAPGEMFNSETTEYIKRCSYNGLNIIGLKENGTKAAVIKESFKSLEFKRIYTKQ